MRLTKGHGTENDFLVLADLDGSIELTPPMVRALCDRRAGIGADGVLRVVRSASEPDAAAMAADTEFFMDYRNSDGSIAETCGNGIRVFLRYLLAHSLVEEDAAVATRGGIRRARTRGDGDVIVDMGSPRFLADRPIVTAAPLAPSPGIAVEMPNPHVVVILDDEQALSTLELGRPPIVEPALPNGQNVEFLAQVAPRHLRMRVHERGVGETRSCGTGICAAAVAVARAQGCVADGVSWRVDVPGGSCEVIWQADDTVLLIGAAVLLAEVDADDEWLRAASADATTGK